MEHERGARPAPRLPGPRGLRGGSAPAGAAISTRRSRSAAPSGAPRRSAPASAGSPRSSPRPGPPVTGPRPARGSWGSTCVHRSAPHALCSISATTSRSSTPSPAVRTWTPTRSKLSNSSASALRARRIGIRQRSPGTWAVTSTPISSIRTSGVFTDVTPTWPTPCSSSCLRGPAAAAAPRHDRRRAARARDVVRHPGRVRPPGTATLPRLADRHLAVRGSGRGARDLRGAQAQQRLRGARDAVGLDGRRHR